MSGYIVCKLINPHLRHTQITFKQHGVISDEQKGCTPIDLKFLPEHFKDHGYATHMMGKWHLGFCRDECLPTNRGFDTFYGCWTGAETFWTHISGKNECQTYVLITPCQLKQL